MQPDRRQRSVIALASGERILAVVAERLQGPGWSNSPLQVHIASNDGRFRTEWLQPEDLTAVQHAIFNTAAAAHAALLNSVTVRQSKRVKI